MHSGSGRRGTAFVSFGFRFCNMTRKQVNKNAKTVCVSACGSRKKGQKADGG